MDEIDKVELNLTEEDYNYIYDRDSGFCQICGGPGKCVHHIIPKSKKKHKDFLKLCLLCNYCHYNIHSLYGCESQEENLLKRVKSNTKLFLKRKMESDYDN